MGYEANKLENPKMDGNKKRVGRTCNTNGC